MTSSYSEKVMKVKTALENIFLKKNIGSSNGDKNVVTDSNGNITTEDKPSYTPTITSATSSSYVIGTLNLNGTDETIYGKDVNSNTLGFQIRTNSMEITPTDKTYRYRLLFQTGDNNKYVPANTSTSTAHNTSKTSTMNTREFLLGGDIRYYSGSTAIAVGSVFSATNVMQQYNITLGYSFNNTSSDLTLTDNAPVYMIVEQSTTNPSMCKLKTPFYTQSLPSNEDGLLYVQLGYATSATTMELTLDHPIFYYTDGKIELFSPNNHTHSQYSTFTGDYEDLTNKPTIPSDINELSDATHVIPSDLSDLSDNNNRIPSNTSDLVNDGDGTNQFLTQHQNISGKQDKSNIVTSWNATLSDEKYPSEKLVKTSLNSKVNTDGNKVLSDNNFTNAYKTTIDGLPNNYQAKGDYASSTHNHSGTYVDGVTGNNTTNGSAIAEIKANTTSKGTIYHPKINNTNLTGVPTSNQTLSFGGNFKVNQVSANTDGHVTGLTERTLTLPSLPDIPQTLSDLELEEDSTVFLSNGNELVGFDFTNNSVSLLDGMLYYDINNQSIIYNNTDIIATLSDIPTIPTVPTASTTIPSADTTNGSYGSGTSYARSNHSHPKSNLYVTSIALVPKSSNATGAITLYYGDEPS